MSDKRNEIIEEQKKAREEFLKLKKMQQGEISPQAKPSEVAIVPKTIGDKFKNFWYHYKFQTIIIVLLIFILTVGVTQCASRPKYDFEVMYFAYDVIMESQTDAIADYFEKYAEDTNGDGAVNVNVINCSVSDSNKDPTRVNMYSKVQAILTAEETVVVYVVDDKAIEYFDNAFDYSIFDQGPISLSEEFYENTKVSGYSLPKGLSVGLRIIEGTTFQKNKKAVKAYNSAKSFMEKIKKQGD